MADSFLPAGSTVVDVIAGALAEHGPMTEERLASVLNDRGAVLGADADSDPAALVAELDETYARNTRAETPQWSESVTVGPIRATLSLAGADLIVHTNSEARLDRVLGTPRKLDPTLTVVEESRQPARDVREAVALTRGARSGAAEMLDPADPAGAAVLDQFIRDYERKWLDEPIPALAGHTPALAGHTPRQAAADPTRRDDLVRLLDSFPSHPDKPGLMSPDRLRAALGLG